MSVLEAAALRKDIIEVVNQVGETRPVLVALADVLALVIQQRFEPKHHVDL
jgi:hypothetical protein